LQNYWLMSAERAALAYPSRPHRHLCGCRLLGLPNVPSWSPRRCRLCLRMQTSPEVLLLLLLLLLVLLVLAGVAGCTVEVAWWLLGPEQPWMLLCFSL